MNKTAPKPSIRLISAILTFVVSAFAFTPLSHAALSTTAPCSPGIPCTGYDVNADDTVNDAKQDAYGARCDGNLMNQMYSRAFLEAERDVLMGMSIIRKPDSILEYTCFDQLVGLVGVHAAPIFSETLAWQNRSILRSTGDDPNNNAIVINVVQPAGELTTMLDDLLMDALEEFIEGDPTTPDGNFSHSFLGGLSALDNSLAYATGNVVYFCPDMQQIWHIAKCIDFGEEDQFWSFEELINIDPRVLPDSPNPPFEECSPGYTPSGPVPSTAGGFGVVQTNPCPPAAVTSPPNHDITNDIIRTSNNCDFLYVIFDHLDMYYELIRAPGSYPGSAVPVINCSSIDPIPTGVSVKTYTYTRTATGPQGLLVAGKSGASHQDKYCPNPGCSYDPAGDVCY
jgi:hypothetical protein